MYGWQDQILRVNLTEEKVTKEKLPKEIREKYIGGRGVNSKLLFDLTEANIDPLGPDNPLIFGVGPTTGTALLSSGRFTVTAKSPLTGGFGDGNAGGNFGPALKHAGYDHIIVEGASSKPVYLAVINDQVMIKDASKLWGLNTQQTQDLIKEELNEPDVQVATIGPAGENKINMACIISGEKRAVGRGGMGAVMGSKKLKAVAVVGTGSVKIARPKELLNVLEDALQKLYKDGGYKLFSKYGTLGLIEARQVMGALTVKNCQEAVFDNAHLIGGEYFLKNYFVKYRGCFNCPIHCGLKYEVKDGEFGGTIGEGPEYVTASALGCKCMNDNQASILYMNSLCNELGIDIAGAGNTLAWAMECYEKGILTADDLDGIELDWGNYHGMIELLKKIAANKGAGELLAKGSWAASQIVGQNSERWSMSVKGQDFTVTELRARKGMGLAYAVNNRGADHLRSHLQENLWSPEEAEELFGTALSADRLGTHGKGKMVAWHENERAAVDSFNMCKFVARSALIRPTTLARLFNPVIGKELSADEIMRIGERIINVERAFNIREGFRRKDDDLPYRIFNDPIPRGPSKGHVITREEFEKMLDEYYEIRGWDLETSVPTQDKLIELGMEEVAAQMPEK